MDVVLVKPLIPQNTGSIARTCAATETPLHIVGKAGFSLSEKAVRRAGLDYWPYVNLTQHATWQDYLAASRPQATWAISKFGSRPYYEAQFGERDALVFGSESTGLGPEFLSGFPESHILQIPMRCPGVRSLNLSNAVAIVLYEALRQGWRRRE